VAANRRAFTVMVRNEAFRWVELLARRRYDQLPLEPGQADAVEAQLADYWDEFDAIETGADARNTARFAYDHASGRIVQILHDPDGADEWRFAAQVDRDSSREEGRAVLRLVALGRAGDPELALPGR